MPDSVLLTMAEVATILHCSKAHVCNAVNGKLDGCAPIPVIRLGRRLLIRRQTLEEWIAQNEVAGAMIPESLEQGRKNA